VSDQTAPTERTLDLFGLPAPPTPTVLRKEERFGTWDARTGLTLPNYYSSRISGERLAAYERSFREERARNITAALLNGTEARS